MKRTLLLLTLLGGAGWGQVERPDAAVLVRAGGRLDLLEGPAGAWRARTLRSGVLDARLTPRGVVAKTQDQVVFLDRDGRELRSWDAGTGRARFGVSADGGRVFAAMEGEGVWWAWAGEAVSRVPLEGPGEVLAVYVEDERRVRLAWRDEAGVRVERLDTQTGEREEIERRAESGAAVDFDAQGRLVGGPEGAERLVTLVGGGWVAQAGDEAVGRDAAGQTLLAPLASDDGLVLSWRRTLEDETVVGDAFEMPVAAVGAASEARFRVKNNTAGPVNVFRLVVDGSGFVLFDEFVIPRVLAAGGMAEFKIRYTPGAAGGVAVGRLRLNDRAVELRGSTAAITLPEVWLNGQWAALSGSQANRVGEAERGVPFAARLRMRATAGEPEAPVWQGAGFRLESQGGGEYRLEADTAANGMREGQLTVSGRSYRVQVFVYEPAPPKPALRLSGASLEFGRQEQVEVVLAETARGSASGQLTVTFEPEAAGVKDDATVGWMPGLTRTVSFTVTPGAAKAQFGSAEFVTLQTGTTAGTLTITATLGGQKDEKRVRLAPAGPALQTATVQRGDRQVTLRVTGYDPMRDTRKAAFTFYLVNGQTAQPGRMEADVSGAFRGYFAESGVTSGAFVLNVQFPVTGTVSELGSVEMELANGIGAVKTQRLAIQ